MHRGVGVIVKLCVLAIVVATGPPIHAQTGVTGTWRVDGVGEGFPWILDLRGDDRALTGTVSLCASRRGVIAIYDGKTDGNTITFKCRSLDGDRTLTLTGRRSRDELALTWEKHVREGALRDGRDVALFGDSVRPRFTAKRVVDGVVAERPNQAVVDAALPQPVNANPICRFTRSQERWVGTCGFLFGGQPSLTVSPAAGITTGRWRSNATPTAVWAGEMRFEGGAVPVEI